MKVMFTAMGAENVSIEYLSTSLKERGHETDLEFDRALFNDKQYFSVNFLAKMFTDKHRVINNIIEKKPDVLALSCFVDNYQWNLSIASEVKKVLDIPVIIGGVHPTTVPEVCLAEDCIDFVCVGEGDECLPDLIDALEREKQEKSGKDGWYKEADYKIGNIYYKKDGQTVKNELLPNSDASTWPEPDKELFAPYIDHKSYYLTVSSKGCIQKCTFCHQNFFFEFEKENELGKFLREKDPDTLISELKKNVKKYGVKVIDIKNNVLSGSRKWQKEFLTRYAEEVAVPFRIMGHPIMMNEEYCRLLKEANCWHVQLGVESMNPEVRRFLTRNETNKQIYAAVKNMGDAGLSFSCDFILGLPGETEADIIEALKLVTSAKGLRRASVFWLQYLPGVGITRHALEKGYISSSVDLEAINRGLQDHYMSTGSVLEQERIHFLKMYHILFRLAPIMPMWILNVILKFRLQRALKYLPGQTLFITMIDIFVSWVRNDHYANMAVMSYIKECTKRVLRFQVDWLAPFKVRGKVTTSEQGLVGLSELGE